MEVICALSDWLRHGGLRRAFWALRLSLRDTPFSEASWLWSALFVQRPFQKALPAVLTVTLAIGVQSMARRNAIIRRLHHYRNPWRGLDHLFGQDRHADPERDDACKRRDGLWHSARFG